MAAAASCSIGKGGSGTTAALSLGDKIALKSEFLTKNNSPAKTSISTENKLQGAIRGATA